MPFQVSPGVNVSEIDLTTVIPAVSTSVGAFAGKFRWGPMDSVTLVTSELELKDMFGEPDSNNAVDWFVAANFLSYSNALRLVRVKQEAIYVAQESAGPPFAQIVNQEDFDAAVPTNANTFYARWSGAMGNDITVELCDHPGMGGSSGTNGFQNWWPNTYFSAAPGTSDWASARGSANDELHIAVIDSPSGTFTGVANGILELWPHLSKATDARNDSNELIFYKDYLNTNSKYLRVGDVDAFEGVATYGTSTSDSPAFANTLNGTWSRRLTGGSDGPDAFAGADYQFAYDHFADSDQQDVSLIMAGAGGITGVDLTDETTIKYIIDIATTRKDAVTFYSPLKADVVGGTVASKLTNLVDMTTGFKTVRINKNTSYAFCDSGWKYQYDKYNDVYRWVPLNGDIAGLTARTDNFRDAWWSPAGYNRGQIKNVVRLAYNPSKAHRDALYQKGVNPVVTFPGSGTLLFGDKTSQEKPSAFDRLNVRRLFIVLEKAISTAAKFSLFEFNDEFTRSQFRNMVEPFLRDVKGRRGINDFKVVCDESNNTGSVIDRNEFVGDIYVKPARSINFIQLNFVAVKTGVDFSEVVGKF